MTFYLKYRPQTVDELDLDSVRKQLTQVLISKSLPHAFLFVGSRGLGKTSAARILAKAINCQRQVARSKLQEDRKKKTADLKLETWNSAIEPCNQCEACLSINQGRALDMIEIDGASNRGIDDIRDLRDKIKLAPAALSKKVYVIDEVHMLTKEAFNALLKTLEEPPDHAIFILATTEPEKLPATIISRCFVVNFNRPKPEEIKRAMRRVARGEKLKIDEGTLDLLAASADGSFRDAVKNLEQLAFSGKIIDKKLFDEVFQKTQEIDLLTFLKTKDVKLALGWIKQINEAGKDWKSLLQSLLSTLRDKLLAYYGVGEATVDFSEADLKELIRFLSRASLEMKSAPIPHLPLELAIIQFCNSSSKFQVASSKLDRGKESGKVEKAIETPTEGERQKADPPVGGQNLESRIEKTEEENGRQKEEEKGNPICELGDVEKNWEKILQMVKPQNHSVEALLRSARPKAVQGHSVIIEVFYEFHKGRLETEKCRQIVENSLRGVLNKSKILVSYILGDKQKRRAPKIVAGQGNETELVQAAEEIFNK
ncbi:DNA polymerase III, subunit gamma and tau [Candidatus Beckwithbacteria bacterium RBG_13_42_9]|uniref:DNA polymerase III subunit gamma/tau n=1 Tax=Candidatus Beckwithbacteria bacterium RBG_13_42_9 TaxID=1797457 RepID=A0A1F5E631_9BACT|nr:MAG: DNA polymerase III, subunit gamma and tau [Candidatus Beckwithbacteria bacterium RBG_13_42_9]